MLTRSLTTVDSESRGIDAESLGSVGYQTHQDRHLRDCEGSALPQDISGADGTDAHVLSDALVSELLIGQLSLWG